jgi:anti-anti-sigma factor
MTTQDAEHREGTDPFRIESELVADVARVLPIGELDMATVGQIDEHLSELHGAGFRNLVLDLRGLTFMDSSGLNLVLRWDAYARENGIDFAVIPGDAEVHRIFEITGVVDRLPFRDP